jgi:sensitive to high expression protein 9
VPGNAADSTSTSETPASPESESTKQPTPPPAREELRNLPSQQEQRRSEASKRFSKAMDDLQTAVFTAGQKLNVLTGYSDIESLKKNIEAQGIAPVPRNHRIFFTIGERANIRTDGGL